MAGNGKSVESRVKALEDTVQRLTALLHDHGVHLRDEDEDDEKPEAEKPADGWPNG